MLPSIESLIEDAALIHDHYFADNAYYQALSKDLMDKADERLRIPAGAQWDHNKFTESSSNDPTPEAHQEEEDFDGD